MTELVSWRCDRCKNVSKPEPRADQYASNDGQFPKDWTWLDLHQEAASDRHDLCSTCRVLLRDLLIKEA